MDIDQSSLAINDELIDEDKFIDMLEGAMERFEESGAAGFDLENLTDAIPSDRKIGPALEEAIKKRQTLRPGRRRGSVQGWG